LRLRALLLVSAMSFSYRVLKRDRGERTTRARDSQPLGVVVRPCRSQHGPNADAKERAMAKYGRKAQQKVRQAMRERKRGTLRSGRSGKKVTNPKQAIAIGLSQARKAGAKVPSKKSASKKRASNKSASTKSTGRKSSAKKSGSKRSSKRGR